MNYLIKKFNSKYYYQLVTLLVFLSFFIFRLPGIFTDMSNSDAWRWHHRSDSFYQGLKTGNLKETYQRYHPGVTLMWISSGVEFTLRAYAKLSHQPFKTLENVEGYILLDGTTKVVLILLLFILLVMQYRCINILYGRFVGAAYVFLMSIEPYMVGINRWYHLTSLEAFLCFTAFLYALVWYKNGEKRLLIFSGILAGFAVLTKFSSVILVLLIIFLIIKKEVFSKNLLYFFSVFLLTIFIFFPALWVSPIYVFAKIYSAATSAVSGNYDSVVFAQTHPFLYYFVIFIIKISPITLLLFVIFLIKFFIKMYYKLNIFLFYIIFYLIFFIFSDQKIERYIIAIMPAVLLICSQIIYEIKNFYRYVLWFCIFIFSIFIFFKYYPVLSLYYSPLFGGIAFAKKVDLLDTNGEFFSQSAEHLNGKGRDIIVYVPDNLQSFQPYYKGLISDKLTSEVEYIVVSKDTYEKNEEIFECSILEKRFAVEGEEILSIYKCK